MHRLAQAHVVGEAGAGAPLRETRHPAEALGLVVAQLGAEPVGQGKRLLPRLDEPLGEPPPALDRVDPFDLGRERLEERHGAERERGQLLFPREVRERSQPLDQLLREFGIFVRPELHPAPPGARRLEQRRQADPLVIDLHLAVEAKPVALALDLQPQPAHLGRAGEACLGRIPLDGEPARREVVDAAEDLHAPIARLERPAERLRGRRQIEAQLGRHGRRLVLLPLEVAPREARGAAPRPGRRPGAPAGWRLAAPRL